jgi:hypothetical protein
MKTATNSERPAGNLRFWLLFFASLLTWPVLYLPFCLGGDGGIGLLALVVVFWWPGLVVLNVVLLFFTGYLTFAFRPRRVSAKIAVILAVLHSTLFIAYSLRYVRFFS